MPITLQYFLDELDGFDKLTKRFGFSPTTLLKKAVNAGMLIVVASTEAKNNTQNTNKS